MNYAEIQIKSSEELKSMVSDLKKEQFNLRFQKVTGELANANRFREIRKTIARAKTALTVKKKKD